MNHKSFPVLLIDDDYSASIALKANLEASGDYHVQWCENPIKGLELALAENFGCILLDINMPLLNGFDLLMKLREAGNTTQVLILSVRAMEQDMVKGLELGADDYIIKPFSIAELRARLKARVRRTEDQNPVYKHKDLVFDYQKLRITSDKSAVQLSAREARLLKLLWENGNQVFSRNHILDSVWGMDYVGTDRTVDNFILRLRKKLASLNSNVELDTIRSMGYRLTFL